MDYLAKYSSNILAERKIAVLPQKQLVECEIEMLYCLKYGMYYMRYLVPYYFFVCSRNCEE